MMHLLNGTFTKKKNFFIPNFKNKITIDSKKNKTKIIMKVLRLLFLKPEQLIKNIKFSKYYGHELPRERAI